MTLYSANSLLGSTLDINLSLITTKLQVLLETLFILIILIICGKFICEFVLIVACLQNETYIHIYEQPADKLVAKLIILSAWIWQLFLHFNCHVLYQIVIKSSDFQHEQVFNVVKYKSLFVYCLHEISYVYHN